jgi:hypothetical protein
MLRVGNPPVTEPLMASGCGACWVARPWYPWRWNPALPAMAILRFSAQVWAPGPSPRPRALSRALLALRLSLSPSFLSQSSIAFFSCISFCFDFTRGAFPKRSIRVPGCGRGIGVGRRQGYELGDFRSAEPRLDTLLEADCCPSAVWGGGKKVKNLNS